RRPCSCGSWAGTDLGGTPRSCPLTRIPDMPRVNDVVEALLQEYAELMAISGGDAFRVRTYEKAARSVGGYHADLSTLDEKGLQQIANVGGSTAKKIQEILQTGTF